MLLLPARDVVMALSRVGKPEERNYARSDKKGSFPHDKSETKKRKIN